MRAFLSRVRGLFQQRALDRQLEEELRFHLDMETETNRKRGMTSDDARSAAQRAFGGAQQISEIYRERRGLPMLEIAFKDLRYAFRTMRRSRAFTAIVVISLALGIGANTAIFTLIDAVMLRSLPVRSPEQLVSVGDATRPTALLAGGPMANLFSYPLYQRLRDQNSVFTGLFASGKAGRIKIAVGSSTPEDGRGRLVSGNYFEVLGVSPILGRAFSSDEDRTPGTSPVVVIGYDYWTNRFAQNPNVLGATLRINGSAFTVIGVAPPHFTGEVVGSPADIWIPLSMQAQVNPGEPRLDQRDVNWLLCMGRLKPGASLMSARAQMTALVQEALIDYEGAAGSPGKLREIRGEKVDVQPAGKGFSWIRARESSLLFTLMAMVGLVLLIACANVANLLLARGISRQKEISVRLALGAARSRIVRQLLTESLVLAAVAGVAGVLLAGWGGRALSQLASAGSGLNPVPFEVDVRPDTAVLAFNGAISLLTAILFGLIPALRSTRVDLTPALKETSRSVSGGRWGLGRVLVIGQLALSTVILIGAGLFMRSIAHLNALDVGYSRRTLVVAAADLAGSGYPPSQRLQVARKLLEHLRSVPGVAGVTVSRNGIFLHLDSSTGSLRVEGFTPLRKQDTVANFDEIEPRYFQVLGIPIIAGRGFDERDQPRAANDVIINDTMARFYFGKTNPLGKSIVNGDDRYTIIGVVKDMKQRDLKAKTERRFYGPLFLTTDPIPTLNFEIRTQGDAAAILPSVRRAFQSFDSSLNVSSPEPVSVLIDQDIREDRLIAKLSGFFGILVLLLAANGLYGVISYTSARRTNEIGLRMAIGASRSDVLGMVLRETLLLIAAGLIVGLPIALAATRLIASTLVGVGSSDPATLAAVSLAMVTIGLLAGFIPAARAARIDPISALRQE